jgi:hypothetical protein
LKEEALDRTLLKTRSGRDYGPVVIRIRNEKLLSSSLRLFGNVFADYLHGQIFAPESISRYFCSCSIPLSSEHIIDNNFSSYQRPCQYLDEFFNLSDIRTSCCLLTPSAEPLNPLNHNMPYTPSTVPSPNGCCNILYVSQALLSNFSKKFTSEFSIPTSYYQSFNQQANYVDKTLTSQTECRRLFV